MGKMFLLFSHRLTDEQIRDAKENLAVIEFIALPKDLQYLWSNIPPDLDSLDSYLKPIESFLERELNEGDFALIQGDFGATCKMANFTKSIGGIPIYATTKRDVTEKVANGKVVKTSIFQHIRFREF